MSDEVIITKRGTYGRVQITLPMTVKTTMLKWMKKSGMGKAEFLRVSLMIGAAKVAENMMAKQPNEGYYQEEENNLQATART